MATATVVIDAGIDDEPRVSMGAVQANVTSSAYTVALSPGVSVVDIDRITGNAETRVLAGTGHSPGTCRAVTVTTKF